jgi:cytochrome oxidase assembly protein ShyY1
LTLAAIGISIRTHPSKNMTERMKRFAIATMIIALTMVAYPQLGNAQITERTDKEKKADAAIEKAYEDTVKREKSSGPAVKSDPWQTIRPAGSDNTKH